MRYICFVFSILKLGTSTTIGDVPQQRVMAATRETENAYHANGINIGFLKLIRYTLVIFKIQSK